MKLLKLTKNIRTVPDPACRKVQRLGKGEKSKLEKDEEFSERVESVWTQVRKGLKQAGFGKKDVDRICRGDS